MPSRWLGSTFRLRRAVPAAALLAVFPAVAGVGSAAAAARYGGAARPAVAAGTISTFAGGIGGPAKATEVAVTPYGLTFSGGHLYVADGYAVRDVAPDDQLSTPAGSRDAAEDFGRPAASSGLNDAEVTLDHSGNLVIADSPGYLRMVTG